MVDNVMRKESILILPMNTIKFIDFPIQVALNKIMENNEPVENVLQHLAARHEKSLAKYNDATEENINTFIKNNLVELYKNAPFTNMVSILDGMIHQKFITDVTMLFDDKRLSSENKLIKSNYYDGSYQSLLEYMKTNQWTCLFIDSIDLLYQLAMDGIDIAGKTIFVSKLGYNYDTTEKGTPYIRHYIELIEKFNYFDLVAFNMFDFSSIMQGEKS